MDSSFYSLCFVICSPEFKPLTLNAKVLFVVDEIGNFIPLEKLRLMTVPLPHTNPDEAGRQEDLVTGVILGKEALLAIPFQLLSSHNVVNLQTNGC